MTVPAFRVDATPTTRDTGTDAPVPGANWSLEQALVKAARNSAISDNTYRFYVVVISKMRTSRFTAEHAAQAAGVELETAWKLLGYLARAGVLTSVRRTGYNEDGERHRYRIYRAAGAS